MVALSEWLAARGAYRDLVAWAEPHGEDWSAAWRACPRGDWLLAVAATHEGIDRAAIARAAAACARLALEVVSDPRAERALDAIERGEDEGSLAAHAAALEEAHGGAVDPAVQAALAAALSALAARAEPREAPGAAAAAVQANVLATGECALELVIRYAHGESARRVRAILGDTVDAPPAPA